MMGTDDLSETVADMRHEIVEDLVAAHIPEKAYAEQWNAAGLQQEIARIFGLDLPVTDWAKEEGIADAQIRERLLDAVDRRMAEKAANFGPDVNRMVARSEERRVGKECVSTCEYGG